MSFHHHRLLVDQLNDDQLNESATADGRGRLWVDGPIGIVAAMSIFAAYIIIDSIIECFVGRWPQPGHNATANPENSRTATVGAGQDPRCSAQLQAIPVLIYVDLPSCSTTSPEAEICPVCLGEYAAGEEVRVLPRCGHIFHKDCIDRWLAIRSSSCPICRASAIKQLGVTTED